MHQPSAEPFGHTPDGQPVFRYTLSGEGGFRVLITNYGGIITGILAPDRNGDLADVVLGFDSLQPYLGNDPYFGAIVGRFANRIDGGRFTLDGRTYQLATNNGPNHLHGGVHGFYEQLWQAEPIASAEGPALRLTYTSADGEEGYPGALRVVVTYSVAGTVLRIDYHATADAPTILNLTNHAYFNLRGEGSGDILGHTLQVFASHFTPVGPTQIPTGAIEPVQGTPFDFTAPTPIGARIDGEDEQLRIATGYDHNFVLDHAAGVLAPAARAADPASGRVLEVRTTQPGVQLYTGNFLDGAFRGKSGAAYGARSGFCLETQHFPDAPNQPDFPSTVLRPGEVYHHVTEYAFSTD